MIIAVTGFRDHKDGAFICASLRQARDMPGVALHIRVGDAWGADFITETWCKQNGVSHHVFKARRFPGGALMPGAGPERNENMLLGKGDPTVGPTDLLLAFPRTDGVRITVPGSGTWGCVIRAQELGIKVTIPPYPYRKEDLLW